MPTLNENPRTADFVLSLANGTLSVENGILAEGEVGDAGAVLGQVLDATATHTTAGAGEGNGTITVSAVGADAEIGTYTLVCTAESANAGTFSVLTPSGVYLPNLTVAVAYASTHISLTVADGSEDWNTGNTITVDVAPGKFTVLDPAGTDGSQNAAGLLWARTDATDADTAIVAVVRQAEAKVDAIAWPDGIAAGAKANAIAALEARGIFLR